MALASLCCCRPFNPNGPHPAVDSPIRQISHFRMQPLHLPPANSVPAPRRQPFNASDRACQEPCVDGRVKQKSASREWTDVRSSSCSEQTEESR